MTMVVWRVFLGEVAVSLTATPFPTSSAGGRSAARMPSGRARYGASRFNSAARIWARSEAAALGSARRRNRAMRASFAFVLFGYRLHAVQVVRLGSG